MRAGTRDARGHPRHAPGPSGPPPAAAAVPDESEQSHV